MLMNLPQLQKDIKIKMIQNFTKNLILFFFYILKILFKTKQLDDENGNEAVTYKSLHKKFIDKNLKLFIYTLMYLCIIIPYNFNLTLRMSLFFSHCFYSAVIRRIYLFMSDVCAFPTYCVLFFHIHRAKSTTLDFFSSNI